MSKAIQLHNEEENIYPNPHFPVGSIYLSVLNTNPSKWFGGEWEQIAKGRTLVGVDTSDTDFDEVQKTGGSKELQEHDHAMYETGRLLYWDSGLNPMGGLVSGGTTVQHTWNAKTKTTGTGDSGNLQPYFTCYIWCRTA